MTVSWRLAPRVLASVAGPVGLSGGLAPRVLASVAGPVGLSFIPPKRPCTAGPVGVLSFLSRHPSVLAQRVQLGAELRDRQFRST